jgi:GNAT superfamily N-acetyltransferase
MRLVASAFDSEHYGIRVAWAHREAPDDSLEDTLAAARSERHDVVFLRLVQGDPWCDELARRGQVPVDTLVTSALVDGPMTIAHPAIPIEDHATVDVPVDIDAVVAITNATLHTTHLHADPRLPLEKTHALYAAWVRNDLAGRAARTLLARDAEDVIGYLTVVVRDGAAIIDLVAVRPDWHGRGVGSALIASFVRWVREQQLAATVGTQADNPALRLYARCGFVPITTHLTYHLWLEQ